MSATCPACGCLLSDSVVKSLWGKHNRAKASNPSPEVAKARAEKAAHARWAKSGKTGDQASPVSGQKPSRQKPGADLKKGHD